MNTYLVPISAVHHPGVVVSDLKRSVEFFETNFGGEPVVMLEGLGGPQLDEMYEASDIEFSIAILAFPTGNVELIEFQRPAPEAAEGACRVGAAHFAFQVEDVEAAAAALRESGVETIGDPMKVEEGPAAGFVLAYFKDPDGNRFELLQLPS